jgi:hypothetical protein
MSQQANSKPIKDFRAGNIQASIWRNEAKKDGQTVVRYSARIQKRYRKKENGNYENTDYFFPDDLPRLAVVTQKAFEYIILTES